VKSYGLGKKYRDKGKLTQGDEFLSWVNIPGSGMLNSPGIRPLHYIHMTALKPLPAYLILVTNEKTGGHLNPWDDLVDYATSEVIYWGDAKKHKSKKLLDFQGNKLLDAINNYRLEGKRSLIPPILHFSKPIKGQVQFNGLCALENLEITWFDSKGSPVRNFRAHLSIIDEEEVSVEWLHSRARCRDESQLNEHEDTPDNWKKYLRGDLRKLDIWIKEVRSTVDQLPELGTSEEKILKELTKLDSYEFEAVVVALFRRLKGITHKIEGTKPIGDGGFDFFGEFRLPRPLNYNIRFLGEVKKYAKTNAVDPIHVSRLVARLDRGQYGVFVTTSYFTVQAQKEVLSSNYPVKLISGIDLVDFMKELKIISNGILDSDWIKSVIEKK